MNLQVTLKKTHLSEKSYELTDKYLRLKKAFKYRCTKPHGPKSQLKDKPTF